MEQLQYISENIISIGVILGAIYALKDKIKIFFVGDICLGQKRLELLNLIQHNPHEKRLICECYDEYKAMGGNHYMDEVFEKWEKEYNK